ncbi:MAG: isoprenyl transferase [Melioribacteraceae bacterium]|nr:MAG: isoprenyl transferase [Melioribacteraceae bacterium]
MAATLTEQDKIRFNQLKQTGEIPKHIAIIMDGNGRWAKNRNLPRVAGHKEGVESVRYMVESCAHLGVDVLTLYTFSTENWNRPKDEVSTLMRLIVKSLQNETNELHKNDIRLTAIGNIKSLPNIVQNELHQAMDKTANNKRLTLNLALSYSGRWELLEAVKTIIDDFQKGIITKKDINEHLVSQHLTTKDFPDPDLLIRSGGEYRISNFLLWQLAYSELYVSDVLWPDFRTEELYNAVKDFQKRERRFGLVSEQVSQKTKDIDNAKKLSKQKAEI